MAGLVVCKVQVPGARFRFARFELPSPSLGGAGPSSTPRWASVCLSNGCFLSWPGVTGSPDCCRPQDIFQPLCLCSHGPSSWVASLPSPRGPRESQLTTRNTRDEMHEVFFFFFLSFQDLFSSPPAPRPGEAEVSSPRQVSCSEMPKALGSLTALYLCIYLWTGLPHPTPPGSSSPATSVPASTHGLTPALNPLAARVQGTGSRRFNSNKSERTTPHCPIDGRVRPPVSRHI